MQNLIFLAMVFAGCSGDSKSKENLSFELNAELAVFPAAVITPVAFTDSPDFEADSVYE